MPKPWVRLAITTIGALVSSTAVADGDADRGRQLYAVCATCHGADARGNPDTQAPQLAGQYDWYLIRQLRNFKSGERGASAGDVYGGVMKPMADALATEQDIEDVVAYIVGKRPARHR